MKMDENELSLRPYTPLIWFGLPAVKRSTTRTWTSRHESSRHVKISSNEL